MVDSTVAGLTPSAALTGTELFYADSGSADTKVTSNQIKDFAVPNPFVAIFLRAKDLVTPLLTGIAGRAQFIADGNAEWLFNLISIGNHAAGADTATYKTRDASNPNTQVIVQNNDELSSFTAYGSDGAVFQPATSIIFEVDGTPGAGDMPGRIIFMTTPDGSNTLTERLRISSTGLATFAAPVKTPSMLVANLPSASASGAGARAFVTNATATTFMSTVAGGGSNAVPVVSDGTNWKIG